MAAGVEALSHRAPLTANACRPSGPPTAEITSALSQAFGSLRKMMLSPGFHEYCGQRRVDPYEGSNPTYWSAFSGYADQRIVDLKSKTSSHVTLDALGMLANTPNSLLEAIALEKETEGLGDRRMRKIACGFNNRVRAFAIEYPAASVASVYLALLSSANLAIRGTRQRLLAEDQVKRRLHGARHEIGVRQMLEFTSHSVREASSRDDVDGIDLFIDEHTSHPVSLDVKGSLTGVHYNVNRDAAYLIRPGRHVILYSLLHTYEFGDSFYLPPDVAATKAPQLDQIIQDARMAA